MATDSAMAMVVDLTPRQPTKACGGEGSAYYEWSPAELPILDVASIGAAKLSLAAGGMSLPSYSDSAKVAYVVQAEKRREVDLRSDPAGDPFSSRAAAGGRDPSIHLSVERATMDSSTASSSHPQAQPDFNYLFKLLLIGDSGVGKSSLLLRRRYGAQQRNIGGRRGKRERQPSEEERAPANGTRGGRERVAMTPIQSIPEPPYAGL